MPWCLGAVFFVSYIFNLMAGFSGIAQTPKRFSLFYYRRSQVILTEHSLNLQPMPV